MGNLLKEALKTLCGVNQWSYAVFWKIGCQNPNLLIWEECYCVPCSGLPGISRNDNPEITFQDYDASWISAENCNSQTSVQAGNKVHLLVDKMMLDNHVNIAGEGLVGRAAFTGNHQWIVSENYHGEGHPPEVLKEVFQQFSAGMQTVAVIPVLPHGVVQFGSAFTIKENMGFVNDVTSLVLQLGCILGSLLSDNYAEKELTPGIGVQESLGISTAGDLSLESNMINASPLIADSFNYVRSSALIPAFDRQTSSSVTSTVPTDTQSNFAVFQASNSSESDLKPHDYQQEAKIAPVVKVDCSSSGHVMNGMAKSEVIPSNPGIWMNQYSSSSSSISSLRCSKEKITSDTASQDHFGKPSVSTGTTMSELRTNSGLISSSNEDSVTPQSVVVNGLLSSLSSNMKSLSGAVTVSDANMAVSENIASKRHDSAWFRNVNLSEMEAPFCVSGDHLTPSSWPAYSFSSKYNDNKFAKSELNACKEVTVCHLAPCEIPRSQFSENLNLMELIPSFVEDDREKNCGEQSYSLKNTNYKVAYAQPQSGEDLFDMFSADFKHKLFSSSGNNCLSNVSSPNTYNRDDNVKSRASSQMYSISEGHSDSGIFSWTGTDNLLDAVVAKVHPSAKKSLDDNVSCWKTDSSSCSAPDISLFYGRVGVATHLKEELLGIPKYPTKEGNMRACSLRNGSPKEDSGTYSQCTSFYESQISSWIEKGHNSKQNEKGHNGKQNSDVSSGYSKKPDETSKTSRKRLKPGENPKPRPKDRQMIQDRVKELREIVPNGAKCSIDALLERTIKHMLFLQSVTKHADKLKEAGESKIISEDGGLLLKDNFEGGATWAYEVSSQSMICPIIVEDLNQPRQMLVEMLCEERGMFLEIADIIRRMGLTILKGIMETQRDKIWARFALEANRDVTRMEIFISLVRLLEQSGKSGIAPPDGISTDNMIVQQYQQNASLSETGNSHNL